MITTNCVCSHFCGGCFIGVAKTPNLNNQNFGHSKYEYVTSVSTNSLHEVLGVNNPLSNTFIIAPTKMAAMLITVRSYQ